MRWVHKLARYAHQDAYARWIGNPKKKYVLVDAPLTKDIIDAHLSGDQPIGIYINGTIPQQGDHYGRIVVLDFDDHDGKNPAAVEHTVRMFSLALTARNVEHVIVRSGGGNGFHIWIVLEKERRVDELRKFGKAILAAVPIIDEDGAERFYEDGTGGVAIWQVEVFPKGKGHQNVALPLARASKRVRISDDGNHIEEWDDDSLPIHTPPSKGRPTQQAKADKNAAFTHLSAALNADDYSHWVRMGMLLIAAFGKDDPWAFDRWHEWSALGSKYEGEDACRQKWNRGMPSDPRVSERSFWFAAKDAGYGGPLPFAKKDRERLGVIEKLSALEYVRDLDFVTFAAIASRRFVPVRSLAFKRFVRRVAYEDSVMLSAEVVTQISDTLDALDHPTEPVSLRFAAHGDKRYFYLGGDDSLVIEIDADGWRLCDEPPVRFRDNGRPLPMPVDGTLAELRTFINVDDDNLPFWAAWVVACFLRSGLAAPIAVLTGPAGSAKSAMLESTVNLIDPKPGAKAGMPSKEDDLVVAAYNGAVVSYDNASTLARLSDALCRLATGGGVRKRTLYHDADVTAFDVIRPVMISGIDPTAYNQDLIERLLVIELQPVEKRIDDETFKEIFTEARPRLLGYVLSLVSNTMGKVEDVSIDDTRLLGFAKVGEAVARCLGYDDGWFADEYRQMLERASDEAADADCVIEIIRLLVANASTHEPVVQKTSSEILKELHEAVGARLIVTSQQDIPANARAMTSRIKAAKTTLERDGYEINQTPKRVWLIERRVGTVEDVKACMSDHRAVPF